MTERKRLEFSQRMWVRRFPRPVHYAGSSRDEPPWLFTTKEDAAMPEHGATAVPVMVTITELTR